MAKRKKLREPNPDELLWGISWSFRGHEFADRDTFYTAVEDYQDVGNLGCWRPSDVVLRAPRVNICPDVHWSPSDNHPTAEFVADNGESFTAGELLFKIHNRFVVELNQMDHKYFEGLSLDEDDEFSEIPLYNLDLGS